MSTRPRFAAAAAFVSCLIAVSAYAQDPTTPSAASAPANLAYIDGAVEVTQGGVAEAADPPLLLLEGDIVRTRNGRAEIVFGDGTLLHLSHDSALEILGEERVRLVAGRALLRVSHAAAQPYVIDTPASSVRLAAQGEFDITSASSGRLVVGVSRGSASIDDGQQWSIRGGQVLTLLGPGGRPLIESFNSARWDAFATWSHDRATGFSGAASASQLPYELRPYGPVLDRYGRWDYVDPHGYVWFPSVGASWRPYYDGSWSLTRYGWTWHGRDRWAWPTHHYGRWGFTGTFWYWMPATVWAPAWVTWSVASDYVSWAPIGWHTPARIDVWGRRDHPAYAPYNNPWRGWTVLPRQQFAPRRNVRVHAIDGNRLDDVTRRVLLSATPSRPEADVAVPRDSVRIPGARGNVRRPVPLPPGRGERSPTVEGPPARLDPPAAVGRRDDPGYAPPSTRSGAAERVGDRGGERRSVPKDAERAGTATERRGADRDPGRAGAPGASGGERPAARQPQSKGDAAGAVQRSGVRRPKG